MTITLEALLKDGAYELGQFKSAHINALQAGITLKDSAKTPTPYVTCPVRGKPIRPTPEEAIRQPARGSSASRSASPSTQSA